MPLVILTRIECVLFSAPSPTLRRGEGNVLNLSFGYSEFNLTMDKPSIQKSYEFGEFRLDAGSMMLYRGDEETPLAPKAVETLLALIERRGEIVSKDELLHTIWPDAFVEESNLFRYVHFLRKILGEHGNGKPYLETFRRRGYRFNGEVRLRRMGVNGEAQNGRSTTSSERGDNDVEPNTGRTNSLTPPVENLGGNLPDVNSNGKDKRLYRAENAQAWEFYLKGLHLVGRITPPEIQKSIEYFQKAIALDPNYDPAYAALAGAYVSLVPSSDFPPSECFPRAEAAARRALKINSRSAEAHAALAWIMFWYKWDWKESENHCRGANGLDPNSADGHYAYAHLLSNTGRHDEALVKMMRARELDPIWFVGEALEGQFLLHAGQTEEALHKLQRIVELFPEFWLAHLFLSSTYIEKGMYKEAEAEADLAKQFAGASNHPDAFKGYALARAGKDTEARKVLDELSGQAKGRYVNPYYFALIHNALGDSNTAIAWLERGLEQRDCKMVFLKVEPKWDNLRSESRFVQLIKKMRFD